MLKLEIPIERMAIRFFSHSVSNRYCMLSPIIKFNFSYVAFKVLLDRIVSSNLKVSLFKPSFVIV